jgi:DNA repair protein RecO (recombination protein O)
MIGKTRVIVLHKTNYSENSIVVQAYSLDYGKVSFLVSGVKGKKSRTKLALFEAMSILDIVGNFKNIDKLIKPTEIKLVVPFYQIKSDISKRMIVLFLSELLHKCIREPNPDQSMFVFIENGLNYLEYTDESVANFHLVFLIELSRYLGFYPQIKNGHYFDLREGVFINNIPHGSLYLQGAQKDLFFRVLGTKIDKSHTIKFNGKERKLVLDSLIQYYQIHISGLMNLKSQTVLETIFL